MNRPRELLVGSVILLAVAVAVFGTLWLQGTNFGRARSSVEVLVASVGQLSTGNPVTYRGVPVGQVASIQVEPGGGAVRVSLFIDDEITLPNDAGVVLGPESLFGDWQIEVVSLANYPGYPFFEVPPVDRTRGVLGGYTLPEITKLTASAEQISNNLAELTDRLELTFNQEAADNLSRAIENIEVITQEVRTLVGQQGEVAGSITASAQAALEEVELAARSARMSFARVEDVLGDAQMDSILTNVQIASAGLRTLATELADEEHGLRATLASADSAFTRVDRITARIETGEGSLGRLLMDSTFAVRAEDVLRSLDLLLLDVRENPHRYVRLSIF